MTQKVFNDFAGQLVEEGIANNVPMDPLEQGQETAVTTICGLMPKISRVFIEETKVFDSPFNGIITRIDDPYGAGIEIAGFETGAVNKKRDGTCMPSGSVDVASQVAYTNFAYNVEINVNDREVNKSVLTADQASNYVAQKLKTPMKTIAMEKYLAW